MSVGKGFNFGKTFKPKKGLPELGSDDSNLLSHASATLGSPNLRLVVKLPQGVDRNEWVAFYTVDFFKEVRMLYGTLTHFCTEKKCPLMSAGNFEYHWADGKTVKKPIQCSAPKYIDYLMAWVQDQVVDESLFPKKIGADFPDNFLEMAKTIFRRLFRVYAHIYQEHFAEVVSLGQEAHLNTSFKHFILFVKEFQLIKSAELKPLENWIEILTA